MEATINGNGHSNGHANHTAVKPDSTSSDTGRFNGYPVRLNIFEGPLDLMLFLVKQNRYDIFDIPISEITDHYLHFVRLLEMLDFELAGDFMVVAAELLVIKSKLLLPPDHEESGAEAEEQDPRFALAERLAEYQRYKEAAETLRGFHDVRARMFARPANGNGNDHHANGNSNSNGNGNGNGHEERKVLLMNDVSLFDLLYAFQRVLDRTKETPPSLIRREIMTVPDRIKQIGARLRQAPTALTFDELCDDCELRIEVIVTFLALLELIRRQRARVEQTETFGEIRILGSAVRVQGSPTASSRQAGFGVQELNVRASDPLSTAAV